MVGMDLAGRTALVTGGASGIGLAAVEALLEAGVRVAINDLPDNPRGVEAVDRLARAGFPVIAAPGDVADPGDAARMVAAAISALGGLDILISNAGTPATLEPIDFADFDAMTEARWRVILDTNLVGPFRCTGAAASALRAAGGCVINTASIAGLGTGGSSLAYRASKAGLVNLTRNLARALGPQVRVNAVAPGLTRTPWTATLPQARCEAAVAKSLLKRWVEPPDIAHAMLFLCTNPAITGQVIAVDGGREG